MVLSYNQRSREHRIKRYCLPGTVYKGNRLRDRYALQVIRALFASSQYDACINYWNEVQGFLPNGLIKQMIRPYIAGAYYRTGAVERAMRIYAECGDIASLIFCAGKQEDKITEIEQLDYYTNMTQIHLYSQRFAGTD